jgi:hypothetical protein
MARCSEDAMNSNEVEMALDVFGNCNISSLKLYSSFIDLIKDIKVRSDIKQSL